MATTPKTPKDAHSLLSPVIFSPKSPTAVSSNFAIVKVRLDLLIKSLISNYGKWTLAHQQGLKLCNSIEAIKTKKLECEEIYTKEMKPHCFKLAVITSIFSDIAANARESLKQLRALSKLTGIGNSVFYRTWTLSHFIEHVQTLATRYEEESILKENIMKNIAHCTSRAELISHICKWEYSQHVDDWTKLHILYLTEEIKHT